MPVALELTDTPGQAELDAISLGLGGFNAADAGPADKRLLAVLLREDQQVVGGLSGYTAWGWFYVQWFWLDEAQRGRGLAGRMLAIAETEAAARGCHGAYIDTFNPVALRVYQRAGYTVFGALPDFPKGRTRSFLSKALR